MAIHTLRRTLIIRATGEEAWRFFSQPRNLCKITPPDVGFDIVTPDLPGEIYAGLMITYRLRPMLRIPVTWLSEITHVEAGRRFIDEQRVGPYAVWHHEHEFLELEGGRVEVVDKVTYKLPFGILGDLLHPWLVRPRLEAIFAYREKAVKHFFPLEAAGH